MVGSKSSVCMEDFCLKYQHLIVFLLVSTIAFTSVSQLYVFNAIRSLTETTNVTNYTYEFDYPTNFTFKIMEFLRELIVPKNEILPAFTITTDRLAMCVLISYIVDNIDVIYCVQVDDAQMIVMGTPNCIRHMAPNPFVSCVEKPTPYSTTPKFHISCMIPFMFNKSFTLLFYNEDFERPSEEPLSGTVEWIHVLILEEMET